MQASKQSACGTACTLARWTAWQPADAPFLLLCACAVSFTGSKLCNSAIELPSQQLVTARGQQMAGKAGGRACCSHREWNMAEGQDQPPGPQPSSLSGLTRACSLPTSYACCSGAQESVLNFRKQACGGLGMHARQLGTSSRGIDPARACCSHCGGSMAGQASPKGGPSSHGAVQQDRSMPGAAEFMLHYRIPDCLIHACTTSPGGSCWECVRRAHGVQGAAWEAPRVSPCRQCRRTAEVAGQGPPPTAARLQWARKLDMGRFTFCDISVEAQPSYSALHAASRHGRRPWHA